MGRKIEFGFTLSNPHGKDWGPAMRLGGQCLWQDLPFAGIRVEIPAVPGRSGIFSESSGLHLNGVRRQF